MTEIAVLAILVVAFLGGYLLSPRERDAVSGAWPARRDETPKSEPAEEGAALRGEEAQAPLEEPRRAA